MQSLKREKPSRRLITSATRPHAGGFCTPFRVSIRTAEFTMYSVCSPRMCVYVRVCVCVCGALKRVEKKVSNVF